MKSRWIVASLGLAVLLAGGGLLHAAKEGKEFSATCPVSGKPAGEDHVVELKSGSKVYFCCDNCPKAFQANRQKFAAQVNRQLLETGQVVQVACPMTGKPVNKEVSVEAGTTEVNLCCKNCLAKYEKASDEEKAKLLFLGAGMKKGYTKQTTCPVSGKPIDAEHSVEYKGEKVYFCCPNCPAAFEKDPEKFTSKLPQLKKGEGKAKKNKKAAA